MKRGLLMFLVMCAFTIAMVPRDRRAVNTEEQEESPMSKGQKLVCAPQTPCAWTVYKQNVKIIDLNITNVYCSCSPDTACVVDEDDTSVVSALVYRCRAPEDRDEKAESDS